MRRPLIGITGPARRLPFKRWIDAFAVLIAGGRPRSLRPDWPLNVESLDGLIVSGGLDIEPAVYKGATRPDAQAGHARDRFELALLDYAFERELPVLGICRGAQLINVHQGGTLHEDVTIAFPEVPVIRSIAPVRLIYPEHTSRLAGLVGPQEMSVNALHSQAVDHLGKDIHISAADEHGIVQAVEHRTHPFLIGVQWHPEWLVYLRRNRALYRALVGAARERLSAQAAAE